MTTSNTTDDIFARPPRSARRRTPTPEVPTGLVRRATCAVCGLRADALICRECAEQPEVSRSRVQHWLMANDDQRDVVFDDWNRLCQPNIDAWGRLCQAQRTLAADDYAARCAAHRAAGNVYGQLLDAHAAYEAALQPLNIERARLEKALEVLSTL